MIKLGLTEIEDDDSKNNTDDHREISRETN
jgi:hypothetical protein